MTYFDKKYDYTCNLSGDESVNSSDYLSSDYDKDKFILGDNKLLNKPLEIYSVRQKPEKSQYFINNDIFYLKQKPYYDESLNVTSEESSEIVSDEETTEQTLFNCDLSASIKYELPSVRRFEQTTKLDSLNNKALQEKEKRLNISRRIKTEDSNIEQKTINGIQERPNSDSVMPCEVTSLPVELLSQYINGEKSLVEIVQFNKQSKSKNKLKRREKKKGKKTKPMLKNKIDQDTKCRRQQTNENDGRNKENSSGNPEDYNFLRSSDLCDKLTIDTSQINKISKTEDNIDKHTNGDIFYDDNSIIDAVEMSDNIDCWKLNRKVQKINSKMKYNSLNENKTSSINGKLNPRANLTSQDINRCFVEVNTNVASMYSTISNNNSTSH